MRYYVTLEPAQSSTPVVVDVDARPDGALDVRTGGRPVAVDVATVGAQLSVRIEGTIVDLTAAGALPDLSVVARGRRGDVRVESARTRATATSTKQTRTTIDKIVFSPMPGRVVKVFVQRGDAVEIGQPLLVMEAMKMENEIRARSAGTVAEVHAVAGSAVESNARLVTLA